MRSSRDVAANAGTPARRGDGAVDVGGAPAAMICATDSSVAGSITSKALGTIGSTHAPSI